MKTPKLITTLFANVSKRAKARFNAATAARAGADGYEADEPTTKLSSAFIVVLILHGVAIGGIYAFNSIKASRISREPRPTPVTAPATKPAPKPIAKTAAVSEAASPASPRVPTTPIAPAVPNVSPKNGLKQHVVKDGENPARIAFANSVKTEELLAANNLKPGDIVRPGETLTIPKQTVKPAAADSRKPEVIAPKRVTVAPTKTTPGVHIVKNKETATAIARIYGLSAAELLKLNKISDPTKIREGQALNIPKRKE